MCWVDISAGPWGDGQDTNTSMTNPRRPLTIMVHIMALGSSFEELLNSSAMCAAASPPTKEPTLVIIPTRHARPTVTGQLTTRGSSERTYCFPKDPRRQMMTTLGSLECAEP